MHSTTLSGIQASGCLLGKERRLEKENLWMAGRDLAMDRMWEMLQEMKNRMDAIEAS